MLYNCSLCAFTSISVEDNGEKLNNVADDRLNHET